MSVVKHFINESIKKAEINEFLKNEFERAGYGGVNITKTPLGTHVVIYTMRPGLVIGRGGETIKRLAEVLEKKFMLPNPQISVAEIEVPELNAFVVASRIASALKRGVHFRRAGYWAINQVMEAGALGVEVIISGKLRTERARYEKFRAGYLPKSGEPAMKYMQKAELHVQLKPGVFGVKVRIMPPDAEFPDKIKIIEQVSTVKEEEVKPAEAKPEEKPAEAEKPMEPEKTKEAEEVKETKEAKEARETEKIEEAEETKKSGESRENREGKEGKETEK